MHKSYQDQLLCEMIFCDRSSGALQLFNPHRLDPPLRAVSKERDLAVNRDEHSYAIQYHNCTSVQPASTLSAFCVLSLSLSLFVQLDLEFVSLAAVSLIPGSRIQSSVNNLPLSLCNK